MIKRFVWLLVVTTTLLGGVFLSSPAAEAATVPKQVLAYGDSLLHETRINHLVNCPVGATCHTPTLEEMFAPKKAWRLTARSYPGTAPCDWLTWLDEDLATLQPKHVLLETAGNSFTECMIDPSTGVKYPFGSQAYYDKYRSDIDLFIQKVQAAGAKMILVKPPPSANPCCNSWQTQLGNIMVERATLFPGTVVTSGPRNAVSNSGKWTQTKNCLAIETAAMGCNLVTRKIIVREPYNAYYSGLHFCPLGYTSTGCAVYSSGAYRFGKAIVAALVSPPKPVVAPVL